MKILFMTSNTSDFVGADAIHYFEREVAKYADCMFAGPSHPLHKTESVNRTVRRLYGDERPDWVFGISRRTKDGYKTVGRIIDLHRMPQRKITRINRQDYDHIFFNYRYSPFASETRDLSEWKEYDVNYWWDRIECDKTWLPWSYEPSVYYPSGKKSKYDVVFLGDYGLPIYPLRTKIFKELPEFCKKNDYTYLMRSRIPGKFTLDKPTKRRKSVILSNPELRKEYLVGPMYARALRRSRVFIFGTSILGYFIKKWTEGMGSGICVVADTPLMAKETGLKEDYNFVSINEDNWKDKLQWVLENESERRKIAERGHKLVRERHTNEVRTKQMLEALENVS